MSLGVAARLPHRVRAFVNVDGNVMSNRSWFEENPAERPAHAARVWEDNIQQVSDPEG